MEYLTAAEAARAWGVSSHRVASLCREGRVRGAVQEGGEWRIPADAPKPTDGRKANGRVAEKADRGERPLPIGISLYEQAATRYAYVDKTLLIRDVLDAGYAVTLFLRPRRFGKSLNMDMLRCFFERADEDTSRLFRDKLIWREGSRYTSAQGSFPVIFLTFKDAKGLTWENTYGYIKQQIAGEYRRHPELLSSDAIDADEQAFCNRIRSGEAGFDDWAASLSMLARCLRRVQGVAPIILIDEYDAPIQQGHLRGYYDEVISFMRMFLPAALKDSAHLSFACLTGITRVAKESIFSGLNNVRVDSMLDERFSPYFGFSPEEVGELLDVYGFSDKREEARQWYDGYRFGELEMYNPWSIVNYIDQGCKVGAYWTMTGSNEVIGELLNAADAEVLEKLEALMRGDDIRVMVDTSVAFPHLTDNPSLVYSFLLMAGYLRVEGNMSTPDGYHLCRLRIPNREIAIAYASEIMSALPGSGAKSAGVTIREALLTNDVDLLERQLGKFLYEVTSYHDSANEAFYHGLVIGLCSAFDNHYLVRSNRESGLGRLDVQLEPRNAAMPGIVIEVKAARDATEGTLDSLAENALSQIEGNDYAADLRVRGVGEILVYGVAFSGKSVSVRAGRI